ncbi:putative holin-like toxin [Lactococcus garvieae]
MSCRSYKRRWLSLMLLFAMFVIALLTYINKK